MTVVRTEPFTAEDVAVPMRDGATLRTDVYAPAGRGHWPVVVRRTPYDKRLGAATARDLASRGYVVVAQDVRGRHGSAGEFAFADRAESPDLADGYDTVEWAATHELSDGHVGMWGHSYDALTGWRAAAAAPPHLGGVFAASMGMRSLDVSRGVFDIGRRLHWYYVVAVDARRRAGRVDGPLTEADADKGWMELERWKWLWHVPLDTIPERVFAGMTDDLRRHLRTIAEEQWAIDQLHARVSAPVFVATGWWDRMVSSIDSYAGVVANGPAALRRSHRLLVGPWGHQPPTWERPVRGSVDFGRSSTRSVVDTVARWFDHLLKGVDNGMANEPPVEIFVVNDGWRHEEQWPPASMREAPLYLRGGGHANGSRGDGRLEWRAPGGEDADTYDYDPRDPVMSLMEANAHWAPFEQRPNDHRLDKLVYRTDPLQRPIELVGPVRATLFASTDAPDTDWVVRLIDEPPDGPAIALSQGILRARYRDGYGTPRPLPSSDPVRYDIALTPVGALFLPGHRIRVDVTSSDFPNHDRNHNTGRDYWSDGELRVARQTIFHDTARPSHVVVPLAQR